MHNLSSTSEQVSMSVPDLSPSPSAEEVDSWLKSLGMTSETVGSSVQGRDILLYAYDWSPVVDGVDANASDIPVILFLSLVHGNAVMGLLSLLQTVQRITQPDALPQVPMRILFMPIVNIDAYTLNREEDGGGCRRTNLRPNCYSIMGEDDDYNDQGTIVSCTTLQTGGVDINRNYDSDWDHPTGMHPDEIDPIISQR